MLKHRRILIKENGIDYKLKNIIKTKFDMEFWIGTQGFECLEARAFWDRYILCKLIQI